MTDDTLPGPDTVHAPQEHPAAQLGRAATLLRAIPDDPASLTRLYRRHLISMRHLDAPLMIQLLRLAARYEVGELADVHPLRSKVLSNLFLDRTHCTGRLSFNAAWLHLGGSLLQFDQTVEQILSRRYAPDEMAELCNSYSDMTVLRTPDAESFQDMLPRFRVPMINAGSGVEEHPTHALADLYTLLKWRPTLLRPDPPVADRLAIGIVGDPSRTRTLRSFLLALAQIPQAVERVVLLQRLAPGFSEGQREELQRAGLRIETVNELLPVATDLEVARELMPTLDLLYVHHLQPVHLPRLKIAEATSYLKSEAMILNPEIQNEEVANRFNDSPHNGYFGQARGSVFVRMALFSAIMG